MDIDIETLVKPYRFTLTPEYDETLADQPHKPVRIQASARQKANTLISQMRTKAGTAYKEFQGRLSLERTRSDELDIFVNAFKTELENQLDNYVVVVVPYEDSRPRIPVRDLTVYAWPRLVLAESLAS